MGRNEIDELEAAELREKFRTHDPTRSVAEYTGRLPDELRDGYYRAETLRGRDLLVAGAIWTLSAAGIFWVIAHFIGW